MVTDVKMLDEMLKVLRANGVNAFRTKEADFFLEVVLTPGDDVAVTEEDDEEMEDASPYNASNIGITFESFEADKAAEARRLTKIRA